MEKEFIVHVEEKYSKTNERWYIKMYCPSYGGIMRGESDPDRDVAYNKTLKKMKEAKKFLEDFSEASKEYKITLED